MHTHHQLEVPAPFDHVQYVLGAVDEYHIWNFAVRGGADDLRWDFRISPNRRRSLSASVSTMAEMTTVSLYRGPFAVVRIDLVPSAASLSRTSVDATVWCSPGFPVVPKHPMLRRMVRDLGSDLAQRARWLPEAPDTNFMPAAALVLVPPAAAVRTASLEQLLAVSRELEGGILAVESQTSCCLLDLERARFARADPAADLRQLVDFGRWQNFDDILCDGDDVVIVPTGGAARVRIRARARTAV